MGKLEGRRPYERPKHSWKHNIKMGHLEVYWGHKIDICGSGWDSL